MGNTQVIDIDKVPVLEAARQTLSDETIKAMRNGAANTIDVAKQIGSDKLGRAAEKCSEATESMIKVIESLCEMIDNAVSIAKKVDSLNN